MKVYVCKKCGWEYDPVAGDPEGGILPGTEFDELPEDWGCPTCGLDKRAFIAEEQS
ncbi:MAG: rubredoxin [Phocaeicola sp.]